MWDAAVYAHADRGDPIAAAAAVDAMRRRRIPVGYVAHSCVVRAYCTADDFEVCSSAHFVILGMARSLIRTLADQSRKRSPAQHSASCGADRSCCRCSQGEHSIILAHLHSQLRGAAPG